ncbi:MAG: hypothetical protein QM667_01795 [Asticcacaulis sp.]
MSDAPFVFIATPCFGGLVTQTYMQSVISLMQHSAVSGTRMTLAMLGNDALITRSRNTLLSNFLNDTDATHLMFIDADIGFAPDHLDRLLASGKPLVAGIYPIKTLDWTRARPSAAETAEEAALHYVGEPMPGGRREGDFAEADYAGTGFMLIRRDVIETLIAAYPGLRYGSIHAFPRPKAMPQQYALFECLIDDETGLYLSEDFAFCHRWKALGGEIWLDVAGRLTHTGSHSFSGNPAARYAKNEIKIAL